MMNGAWITILPESVSEEVAPLLIVVTRFGWIGLEIRGLHALVDKERQLLTQSSRPSVGILVTDVSALEPTEGERQGLNQAQVAR